MIFCFRMARDGACSLGNFSGLLLGGLFPATATQAGIFGGSFMIVGVPRESYPGERRVALVPSVVPTLMKGGLEVIVEAGAGMEAGYPDATYTAKGAKIAADRAEIFRAADIVAQV